jgi:hypothetical protein
MRIHGWPWGIWLGGVALAIGMATSATAQFKEGGDAGGPKVGEKSETTRWQFGVIVKASGGPCKGISGYFAVPTDWPEQDVQVVEEKVPTSAKIQYEMVDGGVKIMNVHIAQLPASDEAKVLVIVELHRREILPPSNTDVYVLSDPKKLPAGIKRYLQPSPKIESRDPKIRDLAKEVGVDKEKGWDHVEAIYDWVRDHVQYKQGELKGAVAALREGYGDCEEITSLFIAICRAADIPARSVWVLGHCYPEFYLDDDKGQGHWFPCQSAGARQFGGITELRPIMQKGDNFRPPKNSKKRQRYVNEYLTGSPATKGGNPPQCQFVREPAPK